MEQDVRVLRIDSVDSPAPLSILLQHALHLIVDY